MEVSLTEKNLFGDDLKGSIKLIENSNKLAKKMEAPKPKNRENLSSNNGYKGKRRKSYKNYQRRNNKNKKNNKLQQA